MELSYNSDVNIPLRYARLSVEMVNIKQLTLCPLRMCRMEGVDDSAH